MKASEIANFLSCTFKGTDFDVKGVNTLSEAEASDISFLANPKYIDQLSNTHAGAVIVREEFADKVQNALISKNPYEDFAKTATFFVKEQGFYKGISDKAFIHETAKIGSNCTIYPFVTIGENAVIGDNCVLFSGVYIGEDSKLGKNCTLYPNVVVMGNMVLGEKCCLQPGVIIGGEGFGFVPTPEGIRKIPQIGNVELGDKVEIGANSTVDRAALASTKIGKGTCLDNLVQIGHNCVLGDNCLIIAQVGIAGSTAIGNNVTIAAQSGVGGHLHIGAGTTIGPRSGVAKDVPGNVVMGGMPVTDQQTYLRTLALMPKFPEIFKRLSRIEKKLEEHGE